MDVRPDVRLEDGPMAPVSCSTCGTSVQVRKSSWDQTTVQWTAEAAAACVERRASASVDGPNGGVFPGCSALRDSIREAAVRGDLEVLQ